MLPPGQFSRASQPLDIRLPEKPKNHHPPPPFPKGGFHHLLTSPLLISSTRLSTHIHHLNTPIDSFSGGHLDREKNLEKKKKKRKLTRKPHSPNLPSRLHKPRLQELDLRRLAAAVQPLQYNEGPSFLAR